MQVEGLSEEAVRRRWAHFRLPPFPQIAIRLLQLANNDNIPIRQIGDLISSEPAFSSEVLTIANSVLYAPRFPITSVQQAVAVLGTNTLKGLCVTVGVRSYLGESLSRPALRAVWRHNLACALVAKQLIMTGSMEQDKAFTAGVMHDIGRLALAVMQPPEYAGLLGTHNGSACSILPSEREMFGLDHCEVGRRLIGDWKLPADFEAIVADHHSPRKTEHPWRLAELIKVSCRIADTVGFAAFPGCEITPYADLLEELPVQERGLLDADAEKLASEVRSKINPIETQIRP